MGIFGLNKPRSRFGKKLDKEGISQEELKRNSKVSHQTASKLCNDDNYRPTFATIAKVKRALKKLNVDNPDDFFNI